MSDIDPMNTYGVEHLMNKEQEWERKNNVYELRLAGKSYRAIAASQGISVGTAHRWVQEVLDATVLPNVDAIRKTEVDRLMRVLDRLEERANDGDDKALMGIVKVSERLCKMLGADAPQRVEVEKSEVSQVDLAIRDLIASQAAKNELRRKEAESLRAQPETGTLSGDGDSAVEDVLLG